ncbi:MAG TPA: M6 family metalloprotease domain-containing protein [Gemmatimonadales bacterium]
MRSISVALGLGAAVALAPCVARAQDIEWEALRAGITLPPAYHALVQQDPDFFTLRGAWIRKAAVARSAGVSVGGVLKLAVIPVLFADSPEPQYTPADIDRVYFTGPYVNGTITEFYAEGSGGRLHVTGAVAPWVRTSLPRAAVVGSAYGIGGDARTGEFFWEALELADPSVEFGAFDNDGPDGVPNSGDDDGVVDVVAFETIEVAGSCGNTDAIWPHRSSISGWQGVPYVTDDLTPSGDSIRVNGYITQSVVDCDGVDIHTSGTMSHELGHVLGLPDIRHHVGGLEPQYRRWLIGCFGLMSGGSWGCDDVPRAQLRNASHMSPYAKQLMGWLSNVRIVEGGELVELTLPPVRTSEEVLQIPLAGSEYLILEYRDRGGFDRVLPVAGVIAYHMDSTLSLIPCSTCVQHYRVYIVEADGQKDLLRSPLEGGNRGTASDVFIGGSISSHAFSPSTRLNDGTRTDVEIYEIRIEGELAHITLSTQRIADERLMQFLVGSSADTLRTVEARFLDSAGNANGSYDVGDLRAYLIGR